MVLGGVDVRVFRQGQFHHGVSYFSGGNSREAFSEIRDVSPKSPDQSITDNYGPLGERSLPNDIPTNAVPNNRTARRSVPTNRFRTFRRNVPTKPNEGPFFC